jgi:hypothetical protein
MGPTYANLGDLGMIGGGRGNLPRISFPEVGLPHSAWDVRKPQAAALVAASPWVVLLPEAAMPEVDLLAE